MNKTRPIARALGVALLIIITEYFFRHYVLFWLPQIGNLRVNDMLAMLAGYTLLLGGIGLALGTHWRQEWAELRRAGQKFITDWKHVIWLVALIVSVTVISVFDQLLWGDAAIPMYASSYQNPALWLAGLGPALKGVTFLIVNGLFVPVAEEYLWRGFVQPRLERALPAALAIGITSLLFSLKHVLVDASMGRFLALIGFGVIAGLMARRESWHHAAILHILANTFASAMALAQGLV